MTLLLTASQIRLRNYLKEHEGFKIKPFTDKQGRKMFIARPPKTMKPLKSHKKFMKQHPRWGKFYR